MRTVQIFTEHYFVCPNCEWQQYVDEAQTGQIKCDNCEHTFIISEDCPDVRDTYICVVCGTENPGRHQPWCTA